MTLGVMAFEADRRRWIFQPGTPLRTRSFGKDLLVFRVARYSKTAVIASGPIQVKLLRGKLRCLSMSKEPVNIEVIQEGDERYMLQTFADGREERVPIVRLPRKPSRFPYRRWSFDKSKKKGF